MPYLNPQSLGWFHTWTVFLPLYPPGIMIPDELSHAWLGFAQRVMDETPSLIGMCFLARYGAMCFTFASKDDAHDFLEAWREAKGAGLWPYPEVPPPDRWDETGA